MFKRYSQEERKAIADAYLERWEKENPRESAKVDRMFRKMVKQVEQEVKQRNREQWIQD